MRNSLRRNLLVLATTGLALPMCMGCGGGSSAASSSAPARSLVYTNPATTGWALVKDASSTTNRLVLNVVGPAGLKTRGVGFNIQAPQGLVFDTFANGLPINDTGVYELQSATPNPGDPVALTGALKPGNLLTVGIYQKRLEKTSKDSSQALCQIALKLDPAAKVMSGQTFRLTVPKAKVISDDIGAATDSLFVLSQKLRMKAISLTVGTVTAN